VAGSSGSFEQMLGSFRFTREAVIRPTDAGRRPASPPPHLHRQPGDTLGGIALNSTSASRPLSPATAWKMPDDSERAEVNYSQ
jgi:hypothetical protein